MSRYAIRSIFLAAAAAMAGDPAIASEPAGQHRIGLSGQVPVLCRVSIDTALVPASAGLVPLGTMKEFCNHPHGYQVVLEYSPMSGDAVLIVDGRRIVLDNSGFAVVARSPGAAVAERKVELQLPPAGAPPTLTFRIEPL